MKKGQAAMEFMMVYGWAIVVAMIGITALFYFDVIDVSAKMPEQADFPPPFRVIDRAASSETGEVVVLLKNNIDSQISIRDTGYSGTKDCVNINSLTAQPAIVGPYEEFKLTFICPDLTLGRVSSYLTFSYTMPETGSIYSTTGFISVNG